MTNVTTSAIIVPGDKAQASRPAPLDQPLQRILPRPPGASTATAWHQALHVQGGSLAISAITSAYSRSARPSDATAWRNSISREIQ